MPKTLRYGLIIIVIVMVLYLVACNFGDVFYSLGRALFEVNEQKEQPEDVFVSTMEQEVPETEVI